MLDNTRKHDIEELYELRKNAPNAWWRSKYEQTIAKIMAESGATGRIREKLLQAVRADDIRSIKRFNHELRQIQADETYGHDY